MKQKIFRFLADLRFAIFILLVIASFSIIGTIIEQDQTIENYKFNYPLTNPIFGFLSWNLIIKLGLDHIYKTWWFLTLILIFAISLLTCTFLQQLPSLIIARRCQFFRKANQFKKLKTTVDVKNPYLSQFIFRIKKNNYSIFQQKDILYCYKGLIGRITPIIVHFSMIIILIGSMINSFIGFNAQEIVPKSETFHIQNIFNTGILTKIPTTSTRVNDFWITYTKKTNIDQFYSNISILNNYGSEIKQQTIFVNHPIRYNNIVYYQTDWNLIGLRIRNNESKIFQYPLISPKIDGQKIWISSIPIISETKGFENINILANNLQGYVSLYNKSGTFISNLEINETLHFPFLLTLVDFISSTGLQIKTDPGIFIVYWGFGLLMISTLISYSTYSQIWILKDQQKIFIGGNTTRAKFQFEFEMYKLTKKLYNV